MAKNNVGKNLDKKALESIYDATASDEIHINDDKLWRYLKQYEKPIKLLGYLASSFTIALTLVATILSSDFKNGNTKFIFDSATWEVLFAAGFVIALLWFFLTTMKIASLLIRKEWMTTESLIKKIKEEAIKESR